MNQNNKQEVRCDSVMGFGDAKLSADEDVKMAEEAPVTEFK